MSDNPFIPDKNEKRANENLVRTILSPAIKQTAGRKAREKIKEREEKVDVVAAPNRDQIYEEMRRQGKMRRQAEMRRRPQKIAEEENDEESDLPGPMLDVIMWDSNNEDANEEGTHIACSARNCMMNVSGECGAPRIELEYTGQRVICKNFQPTQPTEGVDKDVE